MKNPRLAMGMSNPMFLQAIEDMKADPEGAKRKYKGRKEIEDFLREFMGVMGEHVMEMGKKEEGEGKGEEVYRRGEKSKKVKVHKKDPAVVRQKHVNTSLPPHPIPRSSSTSVSPSLSFPPTPPTSSAPPSRPYQA